MRHLLVSPELPPAAGGGIGTYAANITDLLATGGEVVHVIAAAASGEAPSRSEDHEGRLTVHRIPPAKPDVFARAASSLAQRLIAEERIDLVESQEYNAPLHPFLLERGGGRAAAAPPVLIHLHSPSELVARSNGWAPDRPWLQRRLAQEEDCIRAADALLAPCRHLASWTEARFALPPGSVSVIPYPLEPGAALDRSEATWSDGTIVYVGRLEPRKGILEWLEVAAAAAQRDPRLRFELIGENVLADNRLGRLRRLAERIPFRQVPNLRLRGHLPPTKVRRILAHARIAVVPSRWDNLPHTLLEAMASGLPVLTTEQGGMAELVEPGRSGWVASEATVPALAAALAEALATPPARLSAMGANAAERVRTVAGGATVLARHLELRRRAVDGAANARAATRSPRPPLAIDPPTAFQRLGVSSIGELFGDVTGAAAWTLKRALARRPAD